jgi:hypothetical protein
LRTVQTLLQRKDTKMTIGYSHHSPERLGEVVAPVEATLAVRDKKGGKV